MHLALRTVFVFCMVIRTSRAARFWGLYSSNDYCRLYCLQSSVLIAVILSGPTYKLREKSNKLKAQLVPAQKTHFAVLSVSVCPWPWVHRQDKCANRYCVACVTPSVHSDTVSWRQEWHPVCQNLGPTVPWGAVLRPGLTSVEQQKPKVVLVVVWSSVVLVRRYVHALLVIWYCTISQLLVTSSTVWRSSCSLLAVS